MIKFVNKIVLNAFNIANLEKQIHSAKKKGINFIFFIKKGHFLPIKWWFFVFLI